MINDIVLQKGFVDVPVDSHIDMVAEIQRMKKEKNAVLLVHYYQLPEIQDIADYLGDSLGLSRNAAETDADMIVFAGVHFMAETAKILNQDKKVILPDLNAGCSLADSCQPGQFGEFVKANPDHIVMSYINCSSEIKALSDIICTSSNAEKLVQSLPGDQKIIFAPDRNLGAYINRITGRNMLLWDGYCQVHEVFSLEKLMNLKAENPDAKVIAHPECKALVLTIADYIGSTTALLKFTEKDQSKKYIVVTESGILHEMRKNNQDKIFIPAPVDEENCACSDCEYMKLNTLKKLYLCMKYELPEITMDENLRQRAEKPIRRMLEMSNQLGI
ncbi:MAG: quinolinate synthase NadA [Bacteroidetes bacterium]|nr:quinolinate synthase NadA [Bacteroidota bacterium]